MRPFTGEELAALTLARQFPRIRGRGESAVCELVRRTGPIQSQAARAPFLSLASRLPGASRAAITAAHESLCVVRSTSLRGTVHTSTREQHAALAAVAGRALLPQLRRLLRLADEQLADFRLVLEGLTRSAWVDHEGLLAGVVDWFAAQGHDESIATLEIAGPRYALRGHPAMLRRPRSTTTGWDGQAAVVYRAARFAAGEEPVDPQRALVSLVRSHLCAFGPATRRDLAWWSGAGLRQVDQAVAALGDEIAVRLGPQDVHYLDLADPPNGSSADPGPRLLPEYDALLLAYDPAARDRFADEAAVHHSWNKANGVHSPTLLVDGRLRGRWRITRGRGGATLDVEMFPGERLVDPGELSEPATALGAALDVTVTDVRATSLPT